MVTITVTTARTLPATEVAAIEKQLVKRYAEGVKLKLQVDPELIGGIKLRVGTTEIDGTVSAKLETIKQRLLRL